MTVTLLHSIPVTIPPGTPKATPVEISTVFNPNLIDSIRWVFPDGCNGQVGIQIASSHVPIFPSANNEWLVQSGNTTSYDVDGFPDSGDFSVFGYNTGAFSHTIQIHYRVHRREPPESVPGYLAADLVGTLRGGY